MTTETDVKQRLALVHGVLAKAMKACPECVDGKVNCVGPSCRARHDCTTCQGTGKVAMFPKFRQACKKCLGHGFIISIPGGRDDCTGCNGLGWQVRAGGMEGALAGLDWWEFIDWHAKFFWKMPGQDNSMPDADTILEECLKLVCQIKDLEVPE